MIGSGNLTHNLRDFQRAYAQGGGGSDYVKQFTDWLENTLLPEISPHCWITVAKTPAAGHPSDEHLLPFYVALGAAGGARRQNVFMPASTIT